MVYHANSQHKKAGVTILISDKTDFGKKQCEQWREIFYKAKRIDTTRRQNNPVDVCA